MKRRENVRTKSESNKIYAKDKFLQSYNVEADGVIASVRISGDGGKARYYNLSFNEASEAVKALLDKIRHKLITDVEVTTNEILDPKAINSLKARFIKKSKEFLYSELKHIEPTSEKFLIGTLMQEMLGLGKIEYLINDPDLEEIVINCIDEPVRVYHKIHGWLDTNIFIESEDKVQNYSSIIARRVGRQITTLDPLLDAHLVTGDRANAVLYPISTKGNTITLRKFARDPWSITDLIKNNTLSSDLAALLWLAIQYEMNVLISGGTASGKTSLLNVLMPFIPSNQRVLTIEQTRELQLPKHLFWCPMVVRLPNPEGKGGITMLDLLVNSLRMRPDRIILGEIRTAEEASVLFEAMHTGHSICATLHADSIAATISRLINPPIAVPPSLLNAVNACITMFRDRRTGIRRAYQLGEFLISEESPDNIDVNPNILYRWKPSEDSIVAHSKSFKLFDDLSRHANLTTREIEQDLIEKKRILELMVKKNIRNLDEIGEIVREYYISPKLALKILSEK